ncbi:SAPS-domain-containing protein [Daldinia loculata]|uniref:SAPS-domain-containing protein n=1 Tax=Daldinia loculata TaxID=103429 RepID=UPI0020C3DD8C|nr:SAPS-domain-containing protein [Daldinia loculata]KAI1651339.1 SAPS-domain-containing protein [Daldinia loculata]
MFWRFGGYANISTIDTILDKPDFQLEDLLDESDLIQELKQHNTKLIEYLRESKVLEKLLEYVITPKLEPVEVPEEEANEDEKKGKSRALSFGRPRASSRATSDGAEEDEAEKKRNRYAYVAAEVLSSDNWSIYEALMESHQLLRNFWNFLKHPSPLDPLQASYFTKVNEALFDKKTEEMLDLLKSLDDAVPNMLRHVDCPMIMDLLLKIISLERIENGQGIVEWLYGKDVMPTLLSFLGPEHSPATQTSAGDFIKAIITVSANASQNEQACIGPNELTRQLVSKPCVQKLIGYMLDGGNPLTVGVGIVIEVIRKNNSDYDPDVGPDSNALPSSRDPIYLGTLLRLFADHVPAFMTKILNAPASSQRQRLDSTFGEKIEPLGFDRFKTCELMAELLHCSNMALLNEVGSEQVIALRDEERQRLRVEGRLATNRGEEVQSSEDLTMRMRHSSPDDARRLEITNASDDDGFEEVTPLGEMTEDTSHEFVKAEDEIPTGQVSSFLDREDDDFVEEPLSSPRLNVYDSKLNEQQFENPELMVAPLSPKKPTATQKLVQEQSDVPAANPQPSQVSQTSTGQHQVKTPGQQHDDGPSMSIDVQTLQLQDVPKESPRSSPEATENSTTSVVQTGEKSAVNDAPIESEPSVVPREPLQPESENAGSVPTVQAHQPELVLSGNIEQRLEPVVGDYLKMQFVEHQVVPTILSFFFKYPWNNFLHNVVYDIVQQVFNGPMDRGYNPTLAISLFEAADITNAIINGQRSSEQSQARNKTRMGYMGHLTLIAEEVVKFTERNPPELLSELVLDRVMSQDWIMYVEGALAETRERDNAILGGVRPEVAMSNRTQMGGNSLGGMGLSSLGLGGAQGGGSNALAEAGLNGTGGSMEIQDNGSGSSIGPFSISSGLLSGSGFGSSSDEEEDEAEDNEEDVNNEFRAYTDSLNAASSASMDPPSVPPPPPPPPPLNIPPSRARLQLAARLAMHQKTSGGSSTQPGGIEGNQESDETVLDRESESILRNPFEDDGEDDVDDESDDGLAEDDNNAESWGAGPSRGSWWRGALRRGKERFGDGRDDSDSEKDEQARGDEEDEEFGDFAMPEVDKDGSNEKGGVIVKPLPVHPSSQSQKASAFTSLWPFGSKDKEKQKVKDSDVPAESPVEVTGEITGDDGEKIKSTHEATRRTSIEDPDDEEVVV